MGTPTQELLARVVVEEWEATWPSFPRLGVSLSYGEHLDLVAERVYSRVGTLGLPLDRCRTAAHRLFNSIPSREPCAFIFPTGAL